MQFCTIIYILAYRYYTICMWIVYLVLSGQLWLIQQPHQWGLTTRSLRRWAEVSVICVSGDMKCLPLNRSVTSPTPFQIAKNHNRFLLLIFIGPLRPLISSFLWSLFADLSCYDSNSNCTMFVPCIHARKMLSMIKWWFDWNPDIRASLLVKTRLAATVLIYVGMVM